MRTMIDKDEVGRRLHLLRFDRGLRAGMGKGYSTKQVETLIRKAVSEATILRWEKGVTDGLPSYEGLAVLCDFYGVDVSDMLDPHFDTRVWLKVAA